jgi:hypothetical protein
MRADEIKTLKEVSKEYGIPFTTIQYQLKHLEEGKDYRRIAERQSIIIMPGGVKKLVELNGKEV